MTRRSSTFPGLAADWALSSMHASATIWHRASLGGAFAMMSDADRQLETTRMVTEKFNAGVQGSMAAGLEAMQIMAAAATGRLGPGEWLNAPSAVLHAGLRPAMRKVRANSKRLNRRAMRV